SPSLTVSDVRDGFRRHARSIKLPRMVIRGLCSQLDWVEVHGDLITRTVELDFRDVLENTEETLVEVFLEHGPVLDRQAAIGFAEEQASIARPPVCISGGRRSSNGSR